MVKQRSLWSQQSVDHHLSCYSTADVVRRVLGEQAELVLRWTDHFVHGAVGFRHEVDGAAWQVFLYVTLGDVHKYNGFLGSLKSQAIHVYRPWHIEILWIPLILRD